MKPACVLALGNPLRRDDSLGIRLLDELKKDQLAFLKGVDLVDGGTGGFSLLHVIKKYDLVIILDAVDFHGTTGEIRVFQEQDVNSVKAVCWSSTHGIDMLDVLRMAEEIGEKPKKIVFIGIQPKDISSGEGLSIEIDKQFSTIKKEVYSYIQTIVKEQKRRD